MFTVLALAGCGADQDFVFTSPQAEPTTKLMAVYLIGSDLESRGAAGTADLNEMVDGLNQMTPAERRELDLVIAFGGAKKAGWEGVKWMNATQLLEDAKDGVYGNETGPDAYIFTDANFNMAEQANLGRFLNYLASNHGFQKARFLVLWNHGGGFEGYGHDENFNRMLSVAEVEGALTQSDLPKLELLGFDACLMANLEVAATLQNETRYLIASEELEPGHGWNYRYVVPNFVRKPIYDYAVGLVDDYVQNSSHPYPSDGKTLSVLDLDQVPGLLAYLDQYGMAYGAEVRPNTTAAPLFVRAMVSVQRFLDIPGSEFGAALDLRDFVEKSSVVGGEIQANLLASLQHVVLYAKDDGTLPQANGLSVITPDRNALRIPFADYPSQGWASLARAGLELINSDLDAPVLTDLERTAQFLRATFNDALLIGVIAVNGYVENNQLIVLEQQVAQPTDVINRWEIPVWDGTAYHLEFDSTLPATPLAARYTRTVAEDDAEYDIYETSIEYRAATDTDGEFKQGILEFAVANGQVEDYDIKTYRVDENGRLVQDREIEEFETGDQFRVFAQKVTEGEQLDQTFEAISGTFTVTAEPMIDRQALAPPGGAAVSFAIGAKDFAGRSTVSQFQSI